MTRPDIIHFVAITTEMNINIRAYISFKKAESKSVLKSPSPLESITMLIPIKFNITLIGIDCLQNNVYKGSFESDNYGMFDFKIPLNQKTNKISFLQIYETSTHPGIELYMGSFIPIKLEKIKKFIICDFDKTLIATKYSTARELYNSLTSPLAKFPRIEKSISLVKNYISKGYHPFIVSASPHFYENSIRDWLYKNQIYTAGIFLKDYRRVFSPIDKTITPKDLKNHGFYKLDHLVNILNMAGIPKELVLIGDNFESDPNIYLSLASLLKDNIEPRNFWNNIRDEKIFSLNRRQDSYMLNKLYRLNSILKKSRKEIGELNIKIHIRCKTENDYILLPDRLEHYRDMLDMYYAPVGEINTNKI